MLLIPAVKAYLDKVANIQATGSGTPETTYYSAITTLLDAIGDSLKPKILTVPHPSGAAGIPDFGLFAKPKRNAPPPNWTGGAIPERGVVEAKPIKTNIDKLCDSKQVKTDYLPTYGLLLATNLYQWRLLQHGRAAPRETFNLAPNEAAFRALLTGPRDENLLKRFADFLQRCLLTRAPLAKPADVAFFLASYARDALTRLEDQQDLPALAALKTAMEKSLGIAFDRAKGEHLFRSTLVQTLFYGLFAAWVAHVQESPGTPFNWKAAQWSLHVPVARFLFEQISTPTALAGLDLVPLLDNAQETLARVDQAAFFAEFETTQAIQYFYEPFLEFFDPKLRKELGVWYTPPEIVRYMVERVDRVLRSELNCPDGLADPNVWVLDPCCGTGSFLVEVLARIRATLETKGLGDLLADRLKTAAKTRIVGFEIMTAPFIIAHWQIGEALRQVQAPLKPGERAAVYLTNALTGWDTSAQPAIPGYEPLVAESGTASDVKRDKPILVVIGNPPYNAYAGISPQSEDGLVEPYKFGLTSQWGIRKFNLDDLYIRFFRVAERRIAERTGQGVVCVISNFSWLGGASYVVMRQRLLSNFDDFWIDNLNGDSRETGKVTPQGDPDPSIFSTPFSREGIRVGTAIATMLRHPDHEVRQSRHRFRQFWGSEKRGDLLATLEATGPEFDAAYSTLDPNASNRFSLRIGNLTSSDYAQWIEPRRLSSVAPISGLLEMRRGALMADSEEIISDTISKYMDPAITFE